MDVDNQIDKVRTIAIENRDVISTIKVKVDIAENNLDKLTDISLNVSKLLAVHEQRLEASEKLNQSLPALIEDRRQEALKHATLVMDRLLAVDKELREDVGNSQKMILDEIRNVNTGMTQLRADVNTSTTAIKNDLEKQLKEHDKNNKTKIEEIEKRISTIQKFIWVITGGGIVIGAIASQFAGIIHINVT